MLRRQPTERAVVRDRSVQSPCHALFRTYSPDRGNPSRTASGTVTSRSLIASLPSQTVGGHRKSPRAAGCDSPSTRRSTNVVDSVWVDQLNRGMMRVRFELAPLEEVVPWGEHRRLHWFGLTQGWYCLEVDGVELLRYAGRTTNSIGDGSAAVTSWVDYYVVRLWEDLLAVLPSALEPVPDDLAKFFAAGAEGWVGTSDPDLLDDPAVDAASEAYSLRWTDTSYLRFGPAFRWWRTLCPEDRVTMAWQFIPDPDGEIRFSAPLSGLRTVSTEEFVAAVTDFDHRLLQAMQERVDHLAVAGAIPGIELDIPALIREQAQRRTWLPQALARQDHTDWAAVRAGAAILAPHLA